MAIPTIDPQTAAEAFGTLTGSHDPMLTLAVGGVVLARILGFMIVAPFFGSMNIPMTARVAFAVILTVVTVPYAEGPVAPVLHDELAGTGALTYLLMMANQVLVGLMLGFVGAFIFYAIESAGRVIDTQRGSNITDIIAPQTGERTSPTGQWLMMVALMILLTSGLHMVMLRGLIDSFRIFPPTLGLEWLGDPLRSGGGHPALTGVIKEFAELSGSSLLLTLQIAAPAMITLMLTDVLLGIINRGAPQVNVFALSQIVKGPIGIAALMIALIPIWTYIGGTNGARLGQDVTPDGAIPRITVGAHSITRMAERMAAMDEDAKKDDQDRAHDAVAAEARQADPMGEVTSTDG